MEDGGPEVAPHREHQPHSQRVGRVVVRSGGIRRGQEGLRVEHVDEVGAIGELGERGPDVATEELGHELELPEAGGQHQRTEGEAPDQELDGVVRDGRVPRPARRVGGGHGRDGVVCVVVSGDGEDQEGEGGDADAEQAHPGPRGRPLLEPPHGLPPLPLGLGDLVEDEAQQKSQHVRGRPDPRLDVVIVEVAFPKVLEPNVPLDGCVAGERNRDGEEGCGDGRAHSPSHSEEGLQV
mmetsp:Transcript_8378/g.25113  ORF Transcript_8378/g.25113 Transcript_8378/m.25113 type:complete len:237 (-) Transcript_8378:538-1248(-)